MYVVSYVYMIYTVRYRRNEYCTLYWFGSESIYRVFYSRE